MWREKLDFLHIPEENKKPAFTQQTLNEFDKCVNYSQSTQLRVSNTLITAAPHHINTADE